MAALSHHIFLVLFGVFKPSRGVLFCHINLIFWGFKPNQSGLSEDHRENPISRTFIFTDATLPRTEMGKDLQHVRSPSKFFLIVGGNNESHATLLQWDDGVLLGSLRRLADLDQLLNRPYCCC